MPVNALFEKFIELQNTIYDNSVVENSSISVEEKINIILKDCANRVQANRVSFWKLTNDKNRLSCESIYKIESDSFECNEPILKNSFPGFFDKVFSKRIFLSLNSLNDNEFCDFSDKYLKTYNINSFVSITVFVSNVPVGLLIISNTERKVDLDALDVLDASYVLSCSDKLGEVLQEEKWEEEKKSIEKLQMKDSLTGLENRHFFEEMVNDKIQVLSEDDKCGLILIDIDKFSDINERFGMQKANSLLSGFAKRLHQNDLINIHSLARLDGDKFAVFIKDNNGLSSIAKIIKSIKALCIKSFSIQNSTKLEITVSVSIATSDQMNISDLNMIRCAELAMQKAKSKGLGHTEFYDKNWATELIQKQEMEQNLKDAIVDGFVRPFYQPIIDVKGDGIGIEALVRWIHPEKGIIPPYRFLPLAQEKGLMTSIGELMIDKACRDFMELRRSGQKINWVSVNIASEHLYSTKLVPFIKTTLMKYDIPVNCLVLEIVEELIAIDAMVVQDSFEKLVKMGVGLAIDDFGTGYSSLSRLKKLSVTKLKIDKSFVDGLPTDSNDKCIARSIIGLAKGMNIDLVAEGVENEEQAEWLRNNGCEYLQGFLFAKPMSLEDMHYYASRDELREVV